MTILRHNLRLCTLCGSALRTTVESKESTACNNCQCTWRCEAVARAVLTALKYPLSETIRSISPDLSRVGLGISDDWRLATRLASRFDYTNSYLHRFPILDLADPPRECEGFFEFIVCSDVLEHTQTRLPPMIGLRQMLRRGGFAVLSVPHNPGERDSEFYPSLTTYTASNGQVHWTDAFGRSHVDSSPEFHGGAGQTLVFRRFSRDQFMSDLRAAGFTRVQPSFKLNCVETTTDIPLFIAWRD